MITPRNPQRGLDLYIDASGEDDWKIERERYYLHGFMCCGPSPEWIDWMNAHRSKYRGMVHWGNGEFGIQKVKLPNKKQTCRQLLADHPWLQVGIYVFDKAQLKARLRHKYGREITKSDITKRLWYTMGVSYLSVVVPHIKALVPSDPFGCTNIRDIVINNPKSGDKSKITKVMTAEFGRTPQFVAAGHYGIDALDGVLWAFNRCVNLGKTDCLPQPVGDFCKDLRVVLIGISSERPIVLRNVDDIKDFTNTGVDSKPLPT